MGDDGGFSGDTGGYSGDSVGFSGDTGGSSGYTGGFSGDTGSGFGGYSEDKNDFHSNSFSGKDNGASIDSRYNDEDNQNNDSRDQYNNEHNNWGDPEIKYDEEGNSSSRNILAASMLGGTEEKMFTNGDALMGPMLIDEADSGRPFEEDYSERNSCEDCVFGTLVCCDCSIL